MAEIAQWPHQAEAWLDGYGKGAWIAAMVLGFILFWPIGLALLAYMIWGKKMFGTSCKKSASRSAMASARRSSGNAAFDSYKDATVRRLEQEQADFEAFLERLRAAKDKAEFDAFMDENRARHAKDPDADAQA